MKHTYTGSVLFGSGTRLWTVRYQVESPDAEHIASFQMELTDKLKEEVYGHPPPHDYTTQRLIDTWKELESLVLWDFERQIRLGFIKVKQPRVLPHGPEN
ncbi:MAG: hypothetical protein ABI162_07140 [Luteolibacter sp.]